MKKTITKPEFISEFLSSETYKNSFTYDGLSALYDYCEEYEEGTGEDIEFDMVSICCEFSQYESAWEAMEQYKPDDMPVVGEEGDDLTEIAEKQEAAALEWLEENTMVIPVEGGGVIIQDF